VPPLPVFVAQDALLFAEPFDLGCARLVKRSHPKLVAFGIGFDRCVKSAAENDLFKEEEVDLAVAVVNGPAQVYGDAQQWEMKRLKPVLLSHLQHVVVSQPHKVCIGGKIRAKASRNPGDAYRAGPPERDKVDPVIVRHGGL
jgi:hypothetical protein